jgi:hypothetical protein
LSGLFFDVLWYIDLIFGMWLYLDELQFKFEFRSSRMIFGWVMALELVFFVQIWSCPNLSFYVLWYIDLIFGMWLYLDELQFKFEFRSGRLIFGWVMALELVFLFKFEVVRTFFWRPLIYWLDMWLYLDELQFKFEFRSGRMIFGWVMALELVSFVLYFKLSGLFFTSFKILTWYLVYNYFFLNYFCQSFGPWTCNLKSSHCNVILLIF